MAWWRGRPVVRVVVAVADETIKPERWELVVTVPPVVETVTQVLVKCGHTAVTLRYRDRPDNDWVAWQGSWVTVPRPDYEGALEDARRWVEDAERRRLLDHAVDEALRVDGESRG